jgi:peptide/nickel transport system substrate-binding protein
MHRPGPGGLPPDGGDGQAAAAAAPEGRGPALRRPSSFGRRLGLAVLLVCVVVGIVTLRGRLNRLTAAATGRSRAPAAFDTGAGIVYSLDEEPTNFNFLSSDGNGVAMLQIVDRVWPSVFHADPGANVYMDKDLMDSVTLVSSNPQTVVYNINHRATWQDGVPFSADDFIYNWQAQSGLQKYTDVGGVPFDAASTVGYNGIASVTASPDKFTVTTTYSTPFADWRSLFSPVAPAHVMQRVGWNKGLLAANVGADTFISAGPFLFASYTAGRDFILARNPQYWATPSNLATVDFRFVTDSAQVVLGLAGNEIHASYPQPQLDLVRQLRQVPNLKLDERPGLTYEHLDFNEANPFLADVNLRRAIAMSIDRKDLIAQTVGQFATGILPDNNHFFAPGQPEYRDNSGGWATATATASGPYDSADVEGAKRLLAGNGYVLSHGILTRFGRPVTLRITSTLGNALRNAEEAFVVTQLEKIGIMVAENDTPSLRTTLSSHDFDMIIFAWSDTPFPSGSDPIFQTKTRFTGAQNYDSYANRTVDTLIGLAGLELDHDRQTSLYNQADAILWKDMVTLPLFQKPTLLVYQSRYKNLVNNITTEGPVSTMEQWGLPK